MLAWRWAFIVCLIGSFTFQIYGERKTPLTGTPPGRLISIAKKRGRVRVIVGARDDAWRPEGTLPRDKVVAQRERGKEKVAALIRSHASMKTVEGWSFTTIPAFVAEVKEGELQELLADDNVASLEEDLEGELQLRESTTLVGATTAHSCPAAYKGAGQIIVVIDGGVDKDHPFFGSPSRIRDSEGACFSGEIDPYVDEVQGATFWTTVCPNGLSRMFGAGAAAPCAVGNVSVNGNQCHHGTRVAGVAVGDNGKPATDPTRMTGVAPQAEVVPIQILSKYCTSNTCTVKLLKSSVVLALDYVASTVLSVHGTALSAVNISVLFHPLVSSHCDADNTRFRDVVNNLVSNNVAVIAATGNNFNAAGIGLPACLSNVIAVSATDDADGVSDYANAAGIMDLFAPGGAGGTQAGFGILTSQNRGCTGCDLYWEDRGTSLAAPHVAGAFAILRQRHHDPAASVQASVTKLLGTLVRTGPIVTDTRATPISKPRINVNEALDEPLDLGNLCTSRANAVENAF